MNKTKTRFATGACLLALLCLLAGCGEEPSGTWDAASSVPSAVSSATPSVVSEPSALSEPTVSDPAEESSSVEEPSVPPEEPLAVYPGLCFRLPEGWSAAPASAPETLFFASSAEGSSSVSAVYTPLETVQGLTEALLIEEFRMNLFTAWADAGATGVGAGAVSVSLLGENHEALSLNASVDGNSVSQLQVYLFRSDGLYTLTVTAGSLEDARALLAAFEAE